MIVFSKWQCPHFCKQKFQYLLQGNNGDSLLVCFSLLALWFLILTATYSESELVKLTSMHPAVDDLHISMANVYRNSTWCGVMKHLFTKKASWLGKACWSLLVLKVFSSSSYSIAKPSSLPCTRKHYIIVFCVGTSKVITDLYLIWLNIWTCVLC